MATRRKKIILGYGDAKSVCQLFNIRERTLYDIKTYANNSDLAREVREYLTKKLRRPVVYA